MRVRGLNRATNQVLEQMPAIVAGRQPFGRVYDDAQMARLFAEVERIMERMQGCRRDKAGPAPLDRCHVNQGHGAEAPRVSRPAPSPVLPVFVVSLSHQPAPERRSLWISSYVLYHTRTGTASPPARRPVVTGTP